MSQVNKGIKTLNFTIMTNEFDFEAFKQAAIKGLYEGKPLTGETACLLLYSNTF